ncbi:hypothetical protein AXE85_05730 [Gemella sp. oral taxon 928]|uniref:ERF family protein n=1 Tax=Gemella sp. oral taxon 928 TaxID=1785995 RepID=UPI0007680A89|nr:ERF family protein [Gemella sp. oral taxon 928]AME09686.1 hypothetical protein AXE85_05730 [Gemella sp. oral taxon 928]
MKKLLQARVLLQKKKIKKTGYNPYTKSNYFELSDFLPYANEIFENLGLYPHFTLYKDSAKLSFTDLDTGDKLQYAIPSQSTVGANMQTIGGIITYSKRYLYMNALEIAESDNLELNQQYYKPTAKSIDIATKFNREEALTAMNNNNVTITQINGWLKKKGLTATKLEEIPDKELEELWKNFCQSIKK